MYVKKVLLQCFVTELSRFGDELVVGLFRMQMRRLCLYAAAYMYKHM